MSPGKIQRMFGFFRHKIKDISFDSGDIIIEFHRTPRDKLCCPVCKSPDISLYGKTVRCKSPDISLYGKTVRIVRDLPISKRHVYLKIPQNKISCSECGVHAERISFIDYYARHTRRFEQYVHDLCHFMTIIDVAKTLKLNWDAVKNIDRKYLNKKYHNPCWKNLRIPGVDEIAVSKGHKYLTIVVNLENGRVIYVERDRSQISLERFFARLGVHRCRRITAIALDLRKPYSAAVRAYLPNVKIVFDKFHLLAELSRVIDKIRRTEYAQATKEEQKIIKGSKYILLKNRKTLSSNQQLQLTRLLNLNFNLNTTYILKDELYQLWHCPDRKTAEIHLISWMQKVEATTIPALKSFANTLSRHLQGILNYFDIPITTAKVEDINNKIKVLKRKAYGFRDLKYFALKIYNLHNLSFEFW